MKVPALILLLLCLGRPAGPAWGGAEAVWVRPNPLDRGAPARVVLEGGPGTAAPTGRFDGRPVFFFPLGDQWVGLFGADIFTSPGHYPLELDNLPDGPRTVDVMVRDRAYGEISRPPETRRPAGEERDAARLLATVSPARLWEGSWTDPGSGQVAAAFGRQVRRGGRLDPRVRLGVDYAAAAGSPVRAPAGGVVLEAGREAGLKDGGVIWLDHGLGLISRYARLAEVSAGPGRQVRRGDFLGRAGAGGRGEAPGFNYALFLNGARIDPVAFHRLTALLPKSLFSE